MAPPAPVGSGTGGPATHGANPGHSHSQPRYVRRTPGVGGAAHGAGRLLFAQTGGAADAPDGPARSPSTPTPRPHPAGSPPAGLPRPRPAGVHGGRPRPPLGGRPDPACNRGGLALLVNRVGRFLSSRGGLGYGRETHGGAGHRRLEHGHLEPPTRGRAGPSLRPRYPVHLPGL